MSNYTTTNNQVKYNYKSTNTWLYLQLYVFISDLAFLKYPFAFTTIYKIINMIMWLYT